MDLLNFIGSLASIGGLALTISVLVRVGRIERRYVRQAILPQCGRKLSGHVKNGHTFVRDKNGQALRGELAALRVLLEYVSHHVPRRLVHRINLIVDKLTVIRAADADVDFYGGCSEILAEVGGIQETLKALQTELQWGGSDGI